MPILLTSGIDCSQWRALTPSDSLNAEYAAGHTPHTAQLFYMPTALGWNHPEVQRKIGAGDVLIWQRNVIIKDVWDAIDYWRALGKVNVIDLDDHYAGLMPSNPAFPYWILNKPGLDPDPVAGLAEGIRHADALTSPSKIILKDWDHIARGYWLPNWTRRLWYTGLDQKPIGAPDQMLSYNEQGTLQASIRPNSEGWIILGWGGSISHVDSWLYSGIVEALDGIFEKYPQACLKFCGFENRLDYILNRWGDRVIRQGGIRPEHWPMVVSTFDIGLAPLDPRPLPPWREGAPIASYDDRRSWLKAAEYLTAGVPWVASQSLTYAEVARYGHVVANKAESWFKALSNVIDNLAVEKRVAWQRRDWAMDKMTFEANVNRYGDILGRIVADALSRRGSRLPGVTYVPKLAPQAVAA